MARGGPLLVVPNLTGQHFSSHSSLRRRVTLGASVGVGVAAGPPGVGVNVSTGSRVGGTVVGERLGVLVGVT